MVVPINALSERGVGRQIADKPYRRGYTTPAKLRQVIADAHRTRGWLTAGTAVGDHFVIYLLILGTVWVVLHLALALGMLLIPVALVALARQLRALECLVHEGSHFNWSRRRRRFNDLLAFTLSGFATGARITSYRESHLLHHGSFATARDPDRQRYIELDVEGMHRTSTLSFGWTVLRRLPRYQLGWLRTMRATPLDIVLPLGWALVAVGTPVGLVLGAPGFALGAGLWLTAYTVALPVIRFLGESSEHVYSGADTVFDATVSNLGRWQRILIHPHNDGYHTVHHMWPGVPHHALRKLHNRLVIEDHAGYGQRLRCRTRLRAQPRRGVPPTASR